jgi:hypothetical protein
VAPYWNTWCQYPLQVFIAFDQMVNALIPPLFGTLSSHRDGGRVGRITVPPINLLFRWQGPDHCMNAWLKESARRRLPPEDRSPTP